jgi:peptidylprolyl isomerase
LCLAAFAVAAAACGTSSPKPASGNQWTPSPAGTWGKEPKIVVPNAGPPNQLVSEDLIKGTGATAQDGDSISVQYIGEQYSTGQVFDASWQHPGHKPFVFTLGQGQVIPGWDEGVLGMKVGGRRELIIPPDLAYGSNPPQGSGIQSNATLIFIVDLVSVSPPSG